MNQDKKKLEKKLYKWWFRLSNGGIIIINKDNSYKLYNEKNNKKFLEKWKEYANDKNVKAILWSAQSIDVLTTFVNYLYKKNKEKYITMEKISKYLVLNYKKYFEKYNYISKKDYTFKGVN